MNCSLDGRGAKKRRKKTSKFKGMSPVTKELMLIKLYLLIFFTASHEHLPGKQVIVIGAFGKHMIQTVAVRNPRDQTTWPSPCPSKPPAARNQDIRKPGSRSRDFSPLSI